ncbi:hypothetical protein IQ230_06070 [Gloeocapsopsis crepidinum LEGE 06123]|uniref:Uncharacterized protein n=1 Tax=Gloeocapsopsis crepidinum LEGE 06123 TaxID=588587 RepID=A0ABR9UNS4_9CHRO|nr:hypothetical protein [Gloeocapsopsis crepidinum]MBE9189934.1 hypothetical protein [Gloeocapsopsis crepidinum LEGE 06123]
MNDRNLQEELQLSGITATGNAIYARVFERSGIYTISTSRDGDETSILEKVEVTKDECHVITRNVRVRLKLINCN